MRITADTNFLISATQWDNSVSHKLLIKLIEEDAEIFTSNEILDEFREVLERDFQLTKEEIDKVINTLMNLFQITQPEERIDIVKEDPDDNKILECAVTSNSEYILTYDQHLLKIGEYQNIKIIAPEQAMSIL